MEQEEWKDVPEYEGFYQVSNKGRVRGLDRYIVDKNGNERFKSGEILKPNNNGQGRLQVILNKKGKRKVVYISFGNAMFCR